MKKLISLLLIFALVCALVPCMGIDAYATSVPVEETEPTEPEETEDEGGFNWKFIFIGLVIFLAVQLGMMWFMRKKD